MTRLRPRKREGRCYELAWRFLFEDDRFADWKLVHGEARGRDDCPVGHAWLDHAGADVVYDPVLGKFFPRGLYQHKFGAVALRAFTQGEALAALAHGHYGPW